MKTSNLKITTVEVKARGDKFGSSRRDALSQASGLSAFLSKLKAVQVRNLGICLEKSFGNFD